MREVEESSTSSIFFIRAPEFGLATSSRCFCGISSFSKNNRSLNLPVQVLAHFWGVGRERFLAVIFFQLKIFRRGGNRAQVAQLFRGQHLVHVQQQGEFLS